LRRLMARSGLNTMIFRPGIPDVGAEKENAWIRSSSSNGRGV
jgi:hypothetical protein